jgi:hypothetical protein
MKAGNSNHQQTASVEATGRSLLTFLKSEPSGTASIQFRSTQTTKPTAAYISSFRMNTEPTQPLQTTNRTVTECAPSRTFRASAIRV